MGRFINFRLVYLQTKMFEKLEEKLQDHQASVWTDCTNICGNESIDYFSYDQSVAINNLWLPFISSDRSNFTIRGLRSFKPIYLCTIAKTNIIKTHSEASRSITYMYLGGNRWEQCIKTQWASAADELLEILCCPWNKILPESILSPLNK